MSKFSDKLRMVEEEHAEEVFNQNLANHRQKDAEKALVLIGGITVAGRIAQTISSEAMRALITFQEEKLYKALGYDEFVDFLHNSEYAPMTKNQYYDRKALLEKEGDITFDLLNSISMPASKRKLLGTGNVQVEGENVIVVDPATKVEKIYDVKDKAGLLKMMSDLADTLADKCKKLEHGKTDNDRLKRQVTELENALDTERTSGNAAERDEIENCYMLVGSMMKRLNALLEDAPIVRVQQFEDRNLRVLAAQFQQTNDVIAKKLPGATGANSTEDDDDRLASLLDDED